MNKFVRAKTNLANLPCDGCRWGYSPSDCDLKGCTFGEDVGVAVEAIEIVEKINEIMSHYNPLVSDMDKLYQFGQILSEINQVIIKNDKGMIQ